MANSKVDFSHLSVAERLQLIDQLSDSVADAPEALPLTDAQAEELDRRLEACRHDGDSPASRLLGVHTAADGQSR